MARPAKFTTEKMLDGALAAVRLHGAGATLGQVGEQVGAPSGSIYHRFPTREHLFVTLWLRSVRRFQARLLTAAALPDAADALAACAVHIPRFCREHPDEALALTLYRQRSLAACAPPELRPQVQAVNDDVLAAYRELCARRYGRTSERLLTLVATAAQQCPYGLVRPYIGRDVPDWLDEAVLAAGEAILALGDRR